MNSTAVAPLGPGTMTRLEEAFGLPLGQSGLGPLYPGEVVPPIEVLKSILIEALSRPPCLVAFSGGRDSSILLTTASEIARREGLAMPVPITAVFADVPTTEESYWQKELIRHLEIADWERLYLTDELDLLGPYATTLLRTFGNQFAFNAHFSAPLVERARGGTLLTGVGGDEVFGTPQWPRATRLLDPNGSALARSSGLLVDHLPSAARRWAFRSRLDADRSWMTPGAARQARVGWSRWNASRPLACDRSLREWLWPSRYLQLAGASLSLVGDLWGARLVSPFMDPAFIDAAAHRMGAAGYASRTEAIEGVLGTGTIPEGHRHRRSKATFDLVFFNRYSTAFIDRWDGSGLDPDVVDGSALQVEWRRKPRPDARSYSLLKAAWLKDNGACSDPSIED